MVPHATLIPHYKGPPFNKHHYTKLQTRRRHTLGQNCLSTYRAKSWTWDSISLSRTNNLPERTKEKKENCNIVSSCFITSWSNSCHSFGGSGARTFLAFEFSHSSGALGQLGPEALRLGDPLPGGVGREFLLYGNHGRSTAVTRIRQSGASGRSESPWLVQTFAKAYNMGAQNPRGRVGPMERLVLVSRAVFGDLGPAVCQGHREHQKECGHPFVDMEVVHEDEKKGCSFLYGLLAKLPRGRPLQVAKQGKG